MSTGDESAGRDRLRGAFKRPSSRGQATAAVLLAVVGFAAVVQVQSNESDDYANLRQEELIQLLDSLGLSQQRTEQELAELETTRDELRSSTAGDEAALAEARRQAEVLGILAGTVPAVGSGVWITVEDPDAALGTDQLLNGIQELRDAGAEAIEINESVRVVAQTALAPGDGGVVVDGQLLSSPYTIDAIGDPHTLAQAMDFTGGFVDEVERASTDAEVTVQELDKVEVSTVREPMQPQFAEPVPGQ